MFFEAAYRKGSFTSAATELNVSQAAVSKRLKQLEDWIGEAVFVRGKQRLTPTPAGQRVFQTASMTLEFLQLGLGPMRKEAYRTLSIGAPTGFGMFWLVPWLHSFGLSGQAVPTRLITSDNPHELLDGGNDLVVLYGDGVVPGRTATLLYEERLIPLAAPSYAARYPDLVSIREIPVHERPTLLNYSRAAPDWLNWRSWFELAAVEGLDRWPVRNMQTFSQTVGEAIDGNGLALGTPLFLHHEIQSGQLVPFGSEIVHTGRAYFVSHSDRLVMTDGTRALIRHLVDAVPTILKTMSAEGRLLSGAPR